MSGQDPVLTWSTPVDRSLLVDDGLVICPRRGVVEVEVCLSCEHLLGVEGEWDARIVCSYPFPVANRVAQELAEGRRWSRHPRIDDPVDAGDEDHPEDLLPGDVRPERESVLPDEENPWGDGE